MSSDFDSEETIDSGSGEDNTRWRYELKGSPEPVGGPSLSVAEIPRTSKNNPLCIKSGSGIITGI